MSVNGQDPRSNVYLLDGTLLNDFTNGPAGSAAGTALGMETVREFRVEANAYSAEFGRNSGGQINVVTKSGTNDFSRQRVRVPPQRRARRPELLRRRTRSRTSTRNQFGATVGGPIRKDRTFFFAATRALRERLGRTHLHRRARTTTRARGILPARARCGVNPAGRARTSTSSRAPTARPSAAASPATTSRSTRRSTSTSSRRGSTTTLGAERPALRALHARRRRPVPAHRLPAVPADVPLAQPVLHRRVPRRSSRTRR